MGDRKVWALLGSLAKLGGGGAATLWCTWPKPAAGMQHAMKAVLFVLAFLQQPVADGTCYCAVSHPFKDRMLLSCFLITQRPNVVCGSFPLRCLRLDRHQLCPGAI